MTDAIVSSTSPATAAEQPEPAETPALRAIGLIRDYGRLRVVNGLDLEVHRGEIYGFLGRNGAGKTTTIRMLMGILTPTGGEIEFFGERVRRTPIAVKRRIGYVSQSQHFYPWMSARNLGKFVAGFYPNWDAAEYDRLLRVLEIPPGRRSSQLSGGMRMKLALALALAHHPELLILDEPTAGLDPVAQREFLEIIRNQSRNHGRTTLFSTHRIDEVERVADKVGIIDEGVMRYEGALTALRDEVRRVVESTDSADSPRFSKSADFADSTDFSKPVEPDSFAEPMQSAESAKSADVSKPAEPDGFAEPMQSAKSAKSADSPSGPIPPPLPTSQTRPENPFAADAAYELLRDESLPQQRRFIYRRTQPGPWTDAEGWETEALSLEDIFLAYAGMKVAEL